GDFNPIFQGTYSSRIELKQWTRNLEGLLLNAEKLSALADWLGVPSDHEMIWRAWEPVLFNQTHDLASGVMTDLVYEDTVRGYEFSKRLADEMIETRWDSIAARIDTRGEGVPIVVFNPLGWPRTDIAEVEIGFAEPGVNDLNLVDADGKTAPVQLLHADRDSDGGLKRVRIIFLARDVPALGYSAYRALPLRIAADRSKAAGDDPHNNIIENE